MGEYTGILISQPNTLPHLKSGDEVSFSLEQISDWLVVKNGKAHGCYTVHVIRNMMTESERKEHDAQYPYGFD